MGNNYGNILPYGPFCCSLPTTVSKFNSKNIHVIICPCKYQHFNNFDELFSEKKKNSASPLPFSNPLSKKKKKNNQTKKIYM